MAVIDRTGFNPSFGTVQDNVLDIEDFAIFGQAAWRTLDERLGITVGLRGEWTSRTLKDEQINPLLMNGKFKVKDSAVLPKLAIDFRLTPANMIYASAAMGWRPGGIFNQTVMAFLPIPFEDVAYEKETSWTFEVGSKNEFLDGALRVNLALFHTEYKDFQDEFSLGTLTKVLKNAGRAEAKGLELDAEADLGPYLTLTASLGIVDARYKIYTDDAGADFSGKKIAGVPNFNAALGAKVRYGGFYAIPEVRFKGKTFWDRANGFHEDGFSTLHLKASYDSGTGEIYIWGDNLTDEYAFTRAMPSFTNNDYAYGVPIRPLEVGLGMSFNF